MKRFEKVYIVKVVIPGSSYNMQRNFHSEGYFSLKVTHLGANLCIHKENEEGELKALIKVAKEWLA